MVFDKGLKTGEIFRYRRRDSKVHFQFLSLRLKFEVFDQSALLTFIRQFVQL